jgi:hypothetical protein
VVLNRVYLNYPLGQANLKTRVLNRQLKKLDQDNPKAQSKLKQLKKLKKHRKSILPE